MTTTPSTQAPPAGPSPAVAIWLLVGCALVAATLIVGGLTRLTGSGLSMVSWEPISGIIPPLGAESWELEFSAYRLSPEYRLVNEGMSLGEFKRIFWFEYAHRMLGRALLPIFVVPFVAFLWRRRIPRSLIPRLLVIFLLGGAQGLLGWWMVQSGLVDIPRVSPYRLTAHLGLALLLYGLLLWTALGLLRPGGLGARERGADAGEGDGLGGVADMARVRGWAPVILGLVAVTMLSGGFVAGLDAGLVHNTFPKMGDDWIPPGLLAASPWWINLFENQTTVQFNHRLLALLLLAGVTAVWWAAARGAGRVARRWAHVSFVTAWLQATLGVATLLLFVPIPLAALHQTTALVLFTALLGLTFELRRLPPQMTREGR